MIREAQGDAGGQLGIASGRRRVIVDIDELDVVAADVELDAALGQLTCQLPAASDNRSKIRLGNDRARTAAMRSATSHHVGVAELADRRHVRQEAVHDQ